MELFVSILAIISLYAIVGEELLNIMDKDIKEEIKDEIVTFDDLLLIEKNAPDLLLEEQESFLESKRKLNQEAWKPAWSTNMKKYNIKNNNTNVRLVVK
ncbi:MAG: hypothetical protein WC783_00315 [Candidatus Paceibacterota bacterium]|jgi:hypothetical protein